MEGLGFCKFVYMLYLTLAFILLKDNLFENIFSTCFLKIKKVHNKFL